jgi:AcrR family transcriptional regulator
MATTKKTKAKAKSTVSQEKIREAYREFLLTEGKKPVSVFKFCLDNGMKEEDFYNHFGSFEALEKSIWKEYVTATASKLADDDSYASFSSREKILTFYFTLAETLKKERSFVLHQLQDWKNPAVTPGFLKGFKGAFDEWIKAVLNEGKQSGEVAKRPYLDERYNSLFWLHLMFILQFWSNDDSPGFEKTDMAIEKSVNLAYDLIGKGVLDNALDFGKFLYQNSKN